MERWNGRIALVTGASAGIGAGICKELAKQGLTVVGCARNVEKIKEMADELKSSPGKIHAIKCDLTQESDILAMFDEIRRMFGRIDVCVNNAGVINESTLLTGKTSDWRNILEVNVLALCICTREAVKLMREKDIDDGQIIQIGSVAGHRSVPADNGILSFYTGSKFMVRAITDGLRREVTAANTHIRVAHISPGAVATDIAARSLSEETLKKRFQSAEALRLKAEAEFLKPKDIADAVVYILQSPPHVDVNEVLVQPVRFGF